MAKRLFGADVEADDLLLGATKLWCASVTELDPLMNELGSRTVTEYKDIARLFGNPDHILIMHNGVAYDGPVVEKILGIEVKAEIIDTLFLSWYLYPRMVKHGLAVWGEELGIAKPEIENWEDLSLEEYVHRCKEDVRIQVAMWKQCWKHLMLLYGSVEGCWHLIRHLNFKAKCAAMQEKARWKLDVPKTEQASLFFAAKFNTAKLDLEKCMPDVPKYKVCKRPKKPYKADKSLSAHGKKWVNIVKEEVPDFAGNPIDYMEDIKVIKCFEEPNAGSTKQLKEWLTTLGWVPESFKYVRDKETGETRVIPQVKDPDTELLCESIVKLIPKEPSLEHLKEMSVVKHRLSITNGFLKFVDEDGFVYAAIQGLTNTLRFKHKICLNIPSLRKPYGKLIRGLLLARDDTMELCGSDMSSLEDRTKQHYMWPHDPDYVTDMNTPGFDPHLDMCISASLLTAEECVEYKFLKGLKGTEITDVQKARLAALDLIRHSGKGTNYAATYGAGAITIARGANVSEDIGAVLHAAYWERNWSLKAIADECIVKNSRGLKWLWNPVAKLWLYLKADKDRFSTLNQSTGTYCFDRWLYNILEKRPQITGQFHDEGIFEIKKGNRDAMTKILKDSVAEVNTELCLNRELDCSVDFGESYAEIH